MLTCVVQLSSLIRHSEVILEPKVRISGGKSTNINRVAGIRGFYVCKESTKMINSHRSVHEECDILEGCARACV